MRALLVPLLPLLVAATLGACASPPPPPPAPVTPIAPPPSAAPAPSASIASPVPSPVHVTVLAFNDFHGNLEPPAGTNGIVVARPDDPAAHAPGAHPSADGSVVYVPAGGAAYLAATVKALRASDPNAITVSAGDLTGASPLVSSLFDDEPTVQVMNALGLDVEAVGNHDFDRGLDKLLERQTKAKFAFLAANVTHDGASQTIFPPYVVKAVNGVKVAIVGETLRSTPSVTTPSAVKGLAFASEADTVNALVPELQKQGVAAIVLVLHQGGMQGPGGTYDACDSFSGDVLPVLGALSKDVRVVVSAHTHQAYDCTIDGRLVTSAASYGRLVTKIDLTIDPAANALVDAHAKNVVVGRDQTPDPVVAAIVSDYAARAKPITGRVVGWIAADVTSNAKAARSASCETPLGDLIADAQRESTKADIAFMNPGGVRADLVAKREGKDDHAVTYADLFEAQPFANKLVTLTLTGADIRGMLEHQFGQRSEPRILQPSGLTYRYAYDRAARTAKIDNVRVHGKPLEEKAKYRVTVNSFLATGGDGFAFLKDAADRAEGANDLDALVTWFQKHASRAKPVEAPHLDRIEGDGCK